MKAYIIDDELLSIEILKNRLADTEEFSEIKTFLDPFMAFETYMMDKPDIIFIDIQMPEMSGMELAKKMMDMNPKAQIVFVTASSDYDVEAFEIEGLDYLLKPVSKELLKVTLDRYYKKKHSYNKKVIKIIKV